MESSQRDLFIDMVVDRFIFKNNQITLSPSFTFISFDVESPKTGVRFYCEKKNTPLLSRTIFLVVFGTYVLKQIEAYRYRFSTKKSGDV